MTPMPRGGQMKDAGAVSTVRTLDRPSLPGWARGILELVLILALWVLYSLARLLANTSLAPALHRANDLVHVENLLGINWESPLNQLFTDHGALGLVGSYWYASLHYIV